MELLAGIPFTSGPLISAHFNKVDQKEHIRQDREQELPPSAKFNTFENNKKTVIRKNTNKNSESELKPRQPSHLTPSQ